MIHIRIAAPEDAPALLDIYAYYVLHTAITYEYDVPSEAEFADRIRRTLEKYPYLVAEDDGVIVGYAYAHAFHDRAAYGWTAEASIYTARNRTRQGLGKQLYRALEAILHLQGVRNLNACVAVPEQDDEYLTHNSLHFHLHMGYRLAGTLHRCGYKFHRWYGMAYLEKELAPHTSPIAPIRPFPALRAETDRLFTEIL